MKINPIIPLIFRLYCGSIKDLKNKRGKYSNIIKYLYFKQGVGVSSREGNGTPLQHSCLENPMDGGAS